MSLDRFKELQAQLLGLSGGPAGAAAPARLADGERLVTGSRLTAGVARELFASQVTARHLDAVAYELRSRGEGYYTISSTGHEGNVVLGRLLRVTDLALLHYRSGALFAE